MFLKASSSALAEAEAALAGAHAHHEGHPYLRSAALLQVSPVLALTAVSVCAAESPRNDRYTLEIAADGDVTINVAGMPPQRHRPEFTVLWTEADPLCVRNPSHPNYPVAPRNAIG